MRKFMMKYLMVSCKEATFLMAKKEERNISLKERLQLSMHTAMCSLCKKFGKQASKIGQESKFIESDESLSTASKDRIEKILQGHNH